MAVCLDMCDGYIGAVKAKLSKDIPIIVDRFHVIQLLHKRLDKLRSSELKRIKKQLSEEDYRKLKSAIKLLMKKYECYSAADKKILAPLFKTFRQR